MLSEHLFISDCDGGLYDTRRANWSAKAIRPTYRRTFSQINSVQELNATLRNGQYAWPGGYPMFFITSDGAALHFDCVRENLRLVSDSVRNNLKDGWQVVAVDVNWEDPELYCDDCSNKIESAYAE